MQNQLSKHKHKHRLVTTTCHLVYSRCPLTPQQLGQCIQNLIVSQAAQIQKYVIIRTIEAHRARGPAQGVSLVFRNKEPSITYSNQGQVLDALFNELALPEESTSTNNIQQAEYTEILNSEADNQTTSAGDTPPWHLHVYIEFLNKLDKVYRSVCKEEVTLTCFDIEYQGVRYHPNISPVYDRTRNRAKSYVLKMLRGQIIDQIPPTTLTFSPNFQDEIQDILTNYDAYAKDQTAMKPKDVVMFEQINELILQENVNEAYRLYSKNYPKEGFLNQ